jgi:hypothetical protein
VAVADEEKGIIARAYEDGLPVILKLVDEMPPESVRGSFRWLTVISWRYDGSSRNGLPDDSTNQQMIALEDAIRQHLEERQLCRHAYSRTGNGLKELVYYAADQDQFMSALNDALRSHPRYPLEIEFYSDPEWDEFQKTLGKIKRPK